MSRRTPPDPDSDQNRAFPKARSIHESILNLPDEHPEGWVEQAEFRNRYDLPPFRPPRFSDERGIDEVIATLESELAVTIGFVERNTDSGWCVEVNKDRAFFVTRYRDDAANTIVALSSDEFTSKIREAIDSE